METNNKQQQKKMLKIPKEMPSNIIIKPDSRSGGQRGGQAAQSNNINASLPQYKDQRGAANGPQAQSKQQNAKLNAKIVEAVNTKFTDNEPHDWPALYKYKLKYCYQAANFQADSKKNPEQIEFRDKKKEVMIDLIDILDDNNAYDYLLTEEILKESMMMIEKNIFRTFANKNNKKQQQVDPDEDEPHLEEAWPHLQLVYEIFLKFMMCPHFSGQTMSNNISRSFISQFLELFDSEDPRERDYLKTILHRIYGKYMPLRPYIRQTVQNLVLLITYEKEEHNGLTELLEILSSVIMGYATPLKDTHKDFARKVLIPLHKVRGLQNFNAQLLTCMKNFLEKDKALGIDLINGLLKYWPITCPAKEVVFINEVEEILETVGTEADRNFMKFGPKLLHRLVQTSQNMHYQAAERALLLLNNDIIQKIVKENMKVAYPIIVKGLINANRGPNQHWNATVNTITMTVMRTYMELNREMFEQISQGSQQEETRKQQQKKQLSLNWDALERKYGK